jgi:hypothetical protein
MSARSVPGKRAFGKNSSLRGVVKISHFQCLEGFFNPLQDFLEKTLDFIKFS